MTTLTTEQMLDDVMVHAGGTYMSNINGDLWSLGSEFASTGYWVAEKGLEIATFSLSTIDMKNVAETYWMASPLAFVGFWFNTANKTWYIDASRHFENLDAALSFGRDNNQLAIWDVAANDEILVSK